MNTPVTGRKNKKMDGGRHNTDVRTDKVFLRLYFASTGSETGNQKIMREQVRHLGSIKE